MLTPEQTLVYRDAVERVDNLEPFAADELERLKAIPGVTVVERHHVRKGTILGNVKLDFAPRSYPDAIESPLGPPTVDGTSVTGGT